MIDETRLQILTDGAKYDVSCSSSGSRRKNTADGIGNASFGGICHSFTQDGRCISLLKILMSNDCVFDCKYCPNRRNADVTRATVSPEEICELTNLKELLIGNANASIGIGNYPIYQYNKYEGGIPNNINKLTNLVQLNMGTCGLSGEIPYSTYTMSNLYSLDLSNVYIR